MGLSDEIFEIVEQLKVVIKESHNVDPGYAKKQKKHFVRAITHLRMAQASFDGLRNIDTKFFNVVTRGVDDEINELFN